MKNPFSHGRPLLVRHVTIMPVIQSNSAAWLPRRRRLHRCQNGDQSEIDRTLVDDFDLPGGQTVARARMHGKRPQGKVPAVAVIAQLKHARKTGPRIFFLIPFTGFVLITQEVLDTPVDLLGIHLTDSHEAD